MPKVIYVIKVKNSRPSMKSKGVANDIPSCSPEIQDSIECTSTDLQTVNNSINTENLLVVHVHCSKLEVTGDFSEAHSNTESQDEYKELLEQLEHTKNQQVKGHKP